MKEEIWKPIVGWPKYEISSFGNVRREGRSVNPFPNNHGYLAFNVVDRSLRKMLRVHREIALAFIPNPENKTDVRHLDGNKLNCALDNISWGTHLENEMDKVIHGTKMVGERHHTSKLKLDQVLFIRHCQTKTRYELAELFGVKYVTIWNIQKGESWRHTL